MGRIGGEDEDHLAELKGLPYLLSTAEMPHVYWVEGATKKSELPLSSPKRS